MRLLPSFFALSVLLSAALALPAGSPHPSSSAARRQFSNVSDPLPSSDRSYFLQGSPTPLSSALLSRLKVGTNLASSMYCPSVQQGSWTCGKPCDAAGEVEIRYTSGDGDLDPHQNVVWVEAQKAVAVLTEGSNLDKFYSTLNDAVFLPVSPTSSIHKSWARFSLSSEYPEGALDNGAALAHGGFLAAFIRAYSPLLAATQSALDAYPQAERIIVTGHSLGSAIAELNLLAMRTDLQTSLPFEYFGFGSPRTFNLPGAKLTTALAANAAANTSYHHVHHKQDPVPHLGPLIFGFFHSANEVFLPDNSTASAVFCPGSENINCSLGQEPVNFDDHYGPYFGRLMGRLENGDCSQ